MEMRKQRFISIPDYTLGEELFNSISHGLGALLGAAALALMMVRARGALKVTAAALFGASMILLYTMSCVYHALSADLPAKKVLRVLDHCNVFLLVFGTYIPVALLGINGKPGWILFGVVGFAIMVGGLWMLLSLLRGSTGAALSFERRFLKRSYAELWVLCLFAFVWNVFSWSFVLVFVGEEQVRRFDPRLLFLAIFPLAGLFLVGLLIFSIVRARRAPRLVLSLSCAMWKYGAPAQIDWSLENPEEIESLEIALERKKTVGSGKHHRQITVSSQSCSRHAQSMVPGAGSFGFTVPGSANDGCNLAFSAKVKVKGVRRAFTLAYPLPPLPQI